MDNRDRADNAFSAARAVGIPDAEVEPVLKRLLRLFDYNWELIEAEDYRVLLDAYFESKENKGMEEERKHLMENVVPERASIPHFEELEDKASTKNSVRQNKTAEKDGAILTTAYGKGNKNLSQPCSVSKRDKKKGLMRDAVLERPSKRPHLEELEDKASRQTILRQNRSVEQGCALSMTTYGKVTKESSQPCSESNRDKKKGLMEDPVIERLSKRSHFEESVNNSSTKNTLRQNKIVEQGCASLMTTHGKVTKKSSEPCSDSRRDKKNDSSSLSDHHRTQSTVRIPSQIASKNRKSSREKASAEPSSRQPILEPHISQPHKENAPSNRCNRELTKPRTGKIVNDSVNCAQSTPMVIEGSSNPAPQCDVSGSKELGYCQSNFLIASSGMGEVEISLSCKSSIGKPKFQRGHFNAVVRALDDIYIRVRKLAMPEFSVMTLLKDLCEHCVALGAVDRSGSVPCETSPKSRKVGTSLHGLGPNKSSPRSAYSFMNFKKAEGYDGVSDSQKLMKVHQKTNAYDQKSSIRNLDDITKGTENVRISLVDEVGNEDLPKFTYMPHNVVYQDACMQISLARIADVDRCSHCSGDCLSRQIPCVCARETGGEFAYTQQGLLKEEFLIDSLSRKQSPRVDHFVFCQDCPLERSKYPPEQCKGHLVRKFIKECWIKCGCNMKCGNRVVQRGITCKLQVFFTQEGKGWGLRTLEDLPQGAFVCEYVGEILTNSELYDRNKKNSGSERHTYPVTLDADWGSEKILQDHEALCLDATSSGNVARFINHRCGDANLIDIPVQVETLDRHYYHLAFFTTRRVTALEELTWDYGIDFDDVDHPIKAFQCCCGSTLCRQWAQEGISLSSGNR